MNRQDVERIVALAETYAREQERSAVLHFLREMAEESDARCERKVRAHGNSSEGRSARSWSLVASRLRDVVLWLEQGRHRSPGAAP